MSSASQMGHPVPVVPEQPLPADHRLLGPASQPQRPTEERPRGRRRRKVIGLRREPLPVAALDAVALLLALVLFGAISPGRVLTELASVVAFALVGVYRPRLTLRALDDAPRIVGALAVCRLALSPSLLTEGRTAFLVDLLATAALVLLARAGIYAVLRHLRRRRVYAERTVVIGAGLLGCELVHLLQEQRQHGLLPVGFVDAPIEVRDTDLPVPVLGTIDRLDEVLREHEITRMIVAFGRVREAQWVSIMRSAIGNSVEVHVVPRFFDIGVGPRDLHVDEVRGIPLYRVRRSALRSRGWRLKRASDVLASGAALLVLAPVMAVLALAVRTTGPGVLFRQRRVGQHGREFDVLKFRSVREGHDGDTTWSADSGDDRTRVGAVLRQTSLDELPQLWNVLRGDMSLVGPRPERPHFAHRFGTDIPGYQDRHRLPVGLTGWAQVNGLRGDTSIHQRARFDNYYVERWSLWFDVVVLLRTFPAVLRDVLRR